MITLLGAGAVGLTLAARLERAGRAVHLLARRPEVVAAITERGVEVLEAASGARFRSAVPVSLGLDATPIGDGPVLVATRGADAEAALAALARVAPCAVVATLQNDVDHEECAARHFERVIGVVVRQTCTRTGEAAVTMLGDGRLVVGAHTAAARDAVAPLADALRAAGYDVGVSERISEDKWLKLCVNLMSAPNALIRRPDHDTSTFTEGKARLLEEARAVLAAAGIRARSCDGRDRSLDDEIRWQRESLAHGTSARRLPVYNQVWQALSGGGPLEADGYYRRILALAERHGVAAPLNARVLRVLQRSAAEGSGPESASAVEVFGELGGRGAA